MPSPDSLSIGLLAPSYRGFNTLDGGIASHFADLSAALAAEGHRVRVVTPIPPAGFQQSPAPAGVTFVTFDPSMPRWLHRATGWRWQLHMLADRRWRARQAAVALLATHDVAPFDCIETSSSGLWGLSLVRQRTRPPVVTRVSTTAAQLVSHNAGVSHWVDRIEQAWERNLALHSDALVTHTVAHRDEVCHQWTLPASALHLVPHGIPMPNDGELPSPPPGRPPHVLYVGRFEHRKGIDVLLAVIPAVLKAAPGVTFDLVGQDHDGYWQNRFRRENPDMPADRVRFHGKVSADELRAAYRDCDVFVAPSRYESFGLIYVEAMAWGKPVIGCRAGGIPEVVADGETGLLAKPSDETDLCDTLLRLCIDPGLRAQLGRQARHRARELFSLETLACRSVALYRDVIAARTQR
ncbi:MAG: glycosyltransferase family 4 protein [Opitutaceae bacterium]|jgi:hypothetical protein